jgi:hypothetical protein
MLRFFFLIVVFFSISCTHSPTSPQVKTFVQSWKDQYQPHNEKYAQVYQSYLTTVEKIYKKNDNQDKFRSYLDSLNNNSQILADQESAIAELYSRKRGRTIASTGPEFKLYRTKKMTDLSDKLYQGRELRIKEEVGDEMYLDLLNNYNEFVSNRNAEMFAFPL